MTEETKDHAAEIIHHIINTNEYSIWMEGYRATGEQASCSYCGKFRGENFEHACREWAKQVREPKFYDPIKNTYWGCRLFDNQSDAAKSFG